MPDDASDDAPQPAMPQAGGPASTPTPPAQPPPGGAGAPAPQIGGGLGVPVQSLGRQAEARNKAKALVTVLQRDLYGAFEFNSDEGKAIHKALSALGPVFGAGNKDEQNRNAAMRALRQRAMSARGMGGPPTPQPNRGPIPSAAGAMAA